MDIDTIHGSVRGAPWKVSDVADAPAPISLRDLTAGLLDTLQSSRVHIAHLNGYALASENREKPDVQTGLTELLRECQELASELELLLLDLAKKIGRL